MMVSLFIIRYKLFNLLRLSNVYDLLLKLVEIFQRLHHHILVVYLRKTYKGESSALILCMFQK